MNVLCSSYVDQLYTMPFSAIHTVGWVTKGTNKQWQWSLPRAEVVTQGSNVIHTGYEGIGRWSTHLRGRGEKHGKNTTFSWLSLPCPMVKAMNHKQKHLRISPDPSGRKIGLRTNQKQKQKQEVKSSCLLRNCIEATKYQVMFSASMSCPPKLN